jgi:NAD(P)-dependent dehydrogenase (short-subunit alcohol dehydrogenase family)
MAMTKALSHELAPHNVLVNAMLVGFIRADQHVIAARLCCDAAVGGRADTQEGRADNGL